MRRLKLSHQACFVGSLSYSLLSFYFYRVVHFSLQAYCLVPLLLYLCCLLQEKECRAWSWDFALATVLLALSSTYYVLFFVILLILSGSLGSLSWRKSRNFLQSLFDFIFESLLFCQAV